jgi:small subunit ribosomal protein S11
MKKTKIKSDLSEKKRKSLRKCQVVDVHANFGINNTIITISDLIGNKLFSISPPHINFKGPKKSTPYAAQATMQQAVKQMQENHGVLSINCVYVKGPGSGRDVSLRSIKIPVAKL